MAAILGIVVSILMGRDTRVNHGMGSTHGRMALALGTSALLHAWAMHDTRGLGVPRVAAAVHCSVLYGTLLGLR